jgi:hypothetical protein
MSADLQPWLAWTKQVPYPPMSNDGNHIRLVQLEFDPANDDIQLVISTVAFETSGLWQMDGLPPYEALSYAWLSNWKLPLAEVYINNTCCEIPINLFRFLQNRRHVPPNKGKAFLWIDALCTYSNRSRIKHLRNLRCLFLHLGAKSGSGKFTPRFQSGNLLIRRFLPSSGNAAFVSPCPFFVSIWPPTLVLKLREFSLPLASLIRGRQSAEK